MARLRDLPPVVWGPITGQHVAFIGADVDGAGGFDWIEGGADRGFHLAGNPGSGSDAPIDGLLIVKADGYTPDPKTKFLDKNMMRIFV